MIILHNLHIIGDGLKHIQIYGDKIQAAVQDETILQSSSEAIHLSFDGAIAFPGLINSHDHLDFNLFPRLGNRVYNNYVEWANDIHTQNKKDIDEVLSIPQALRTKWGIYKNLLNGITTVVNHGACLMVEKPPIRVFQKSISLHSVRLEKSWRLKLNSPFAKGNPFAIHVGEGTDNMSSREIDQLIKWNFFKRKMIAIHGVAMDKQQAKAFDALAWCPDSNYFLLNRTANINTLKYQTKIVFGTDSTLTANWNLWEHLRIARGTKMITDMELFNMLTMVPATVWGLRNYGISESGQMADIVVAGSKSGEYTLNSFFELNPEDILLIIQSGKIRLFDESLREQLDNAGFKMHSFSNIKINGISKYVTGDLPGLMNEIMKYNPDASFPLSLIE